MKAVYSINDLLDRSALDQDATKPAQLAVIGYPVKHSASPQMHQAALDLDGNDIRYVRVEVEPSKVDLAFSRMEKAGFLGCNVTVPHKLEAMEACDELTDSAKQLGAVNTVHFIDGKRIGHNTDGPGLAAAIKHSFGKKLGDLRVLLLGAGGGAGRAIATQCAIEKSPKLILSNRTISKLNPLVEAVNEISPNTEVLAISNQDQDIADIIGEIDLIINSTSLGLMQEDDCPLNPELLSSDHVVYDAIYNPPVTKLLAAAQDKGCKTANGMSMLIHQGALAYKMWLGDMPSIDAMEAALI